MSASIMYVTHANNNVLQVSVVAATGPIHCTNRPFVHRGSLASSASTTASIRLALAEENAAMRAYLICRNFSVNDGMYPAGHDHGGIPQGFPVAIGTGRRNRYSEDPSSSNDSGSSPESHEGRRLHRSERRSNGPARALAYTKRSHNHF